MNNFSWNTEGNISMPPLDFKKIEKWLTHVANSHGKLIGDINYIFCDDAHILEVNREYLNHDYFTDIITFDRCLKNLLRGDIILSLETVDSNAKKFSQPIELETLRVIVHGLLHLCGINDKEPGEREIMEREENQALSIYPEHTI